MSIWSTLQGIVGGKRATYVLVWREHVAHGAVMKGEPIDGKSDTDALSLVRAKFMHVPPDWTFWVLFRPDDAMVTAEQGPKIAKWLGDFARVGADSHVLSTLASVRRHNTPVSRPLHKVKLKGRGSSPDVKTI
jgi:hypothetical protein